MHRIILVEQHVKGGRELFGVIFKHEHSNTGDIQFAKREDIQRTEKRGCVGIFSRKSNESNSTFLKFE